MNTRIAEATTLTTPHQIFPAILVQTAAILVQKQRSDKKNSFYSLEYSFSRKFKLKGSWNIEQVKYLCNEEAKSVIFSLFDVLDFRPISMLSAFS